MKSGKGNLEGKEEEDEEFDTKKDDIPSINITKDSKNSDRANAIRSKHSVTEQRRRSKINDRYQILRELIPHSDQKRDTASFLLEVIQYVQFLHEKVQKYEESYQCWSSEPTKLMPWRNSHWGVQSFANQAQTMKNGSGHPTTTQPVQQNPIESDHARDASCRSIDPQIEFPNKSMPVSVANDGAFSHTLSRPDSDARSIECQTTADALNHQDELTIEGGTISISSAYSQELLNSLTQALQSTGLNLSQANISVQINLGKRANRGPTSPGISTAKDHDILTPSCNQPVEPFRDANYSEDSYQAQKKLEI